MFCVVCSKAFLSFFQKKNKNFFLSLSQTFIVCEYGPKPVPCDEEEGEEEEDEEEEEEEDRRA